MRHPLYMAVGGVCLILAVIIAAEFNLTISDVAASPSDQPTGEVAAGGDQAPDDVDTQVASILDRPLFAPDRRGPPAPKAADQAAGPADRAAPEIRGRLGGITIGPGDDKQAVFERGEGEKPLVVKEGDDVDGWTVSSIEPDKVVLTSTFGQREIQPTFGTPGDAPQPRNKPSSPKEVAGVESPVNPPIQPPPASRRVPPRAMPPGVGQPFPGINPRARRPAPTPAMRR
jgi:hypothetical protein